MSEARWEIRDGERVLGPYTDEDVFRAIAGTLPPTSPARLLGQDEWRPIGTVSPFAEVFMRRAVGSAGPPHAVPLSVQARRERKIDTLGGGCFVQGLGAILGGALIFYGIAVAREAGGALFGLVTGLLVVLGGLIVGRRLSTRWTCGACGNPIAGAEVRMCPTCKASLG
jgi:hypothetical protein